MRRELQGALKKCAMDKAYNDLFTALILHRAKESRSYKEEGLTWDEFCESVNIPRRTADQILEDIRPIVDRFSAGFADFSGLKLNEIRRLGCAVSADLAEITTTGIVYEGEVFEYKKEDLKELLDRFEGSYKARLEDQKRQAEEDRKRVEEEKQRLERENAEFSAAVNELNSRVKEFERLYPEDDRHWVSANRQIHASLYEPFLAELRAFVMNDRVVNNAEAHDYLRELYDRVTGNLADLNEYYRTKTGLSFVRDKG